MRHAYKKDPKRDPNFKNYPDGLEVEVSISLGLTVGDFPKIRVPYFGVIIVRIPLFRALY